MLNQSHLQRLAFIKYLVNLGVRQSETGEPLNSAAILLFHDSIELFLQLASKYLNAGSEKPDFMQYWDILSKKLPEGKQLPQKESMRRLNKSRVALKHHGTLPSKMDIESFKVVSLLFFQDATPLIFGVSFSDISLSDFINLEEARNFLKIAEQCLVRGEIEESIDNSAISFKIMLQDYLYRKVLRYGNTPFTFGEDLYGYSSTFMGLGSTMMHPPMAASKEFMHKLSKFFDSIAFTINEMQGAIRIMALGIDYPKYTRFKLLTPTVAHDEGGNKYFFTGTRELPNVDEKDAKFCIDFILEAAIKLQEFDYTIGE